MVSEIVYELPNGKYGHLITTVDDNIDFNILQIIGTELQVVYHISALEHLRQCEFNLENIKKIFTSWFNNSREEDDFETNAEGDAVIIFHNSNEFHISNWFELRDIISKCLEY